MPTPWRRLTGGTASPLLSPVPPVLQPPLAPQCLVAGAACPALDQRGTRLAAVRTHALPIRVIYGEGWRSPSGPTLSRDEAPSVRPPHRSGANTSCWSRPGFSFQSYSPIRPGPTECSEERPMKPATTEHSPEGQWKRLAWFACIWFASIGALTIVALAIRAVLKTQVLPLAVKACTLQNTTADAGL